MGTQHEHVSCSFSVNTRWSCFRYPLCLMKTRETNGETRGLRRWRGRGGYWRRERERLFFVFCFFPQVFESSPSFCHWNISTLIKKVMMTPLTHAHVHRLIHPEHSWKSFRDQGFCKHGLSGVCVWEAACVCVFLQGSYAFWEIISQPMTDFPSGEGVLPGRIAAHWCHENQRLQENFKTLSRE